MCTMDHAALPFVLFETGEIALATDLEPTLQDELCVLGTSALLVELFKPLADPDRGITAYLLFADRATLQLVESFDGAFKFPSSSTDTLVMLMLDAADIGAELILAYLKIFTKCFEPRQGLFESAYQWLWVECLTSRRASRSRRRQ